MSGAQVTGNYFVCVTETKLVGSIKSTNGGEDVSAYTETSGQLLFIRISAEQTHFKQAIAVSHCDIATVLHPVPPLKQRPLSKIPAAFFQSLGVNAFHVNADKGEVYNLIAKGLEAKNKSNPWHGATDSAHTAIATIANEITQGLPKHHAQTSIVSTWKELKNTMSKQSESKSLDTLLEPALVSTQSNKKKLSMGPIFTGEESWVLRVFTFAHVDLKTNEVQWYNTPRALEANQELQRVWAYFEPVVPGDFLREPLARSDSFDNTSVENLLSQLKVKARHTGFSGIDGPGVVWAIGKFDIEPYHKSLIK
jgi:hypothetical protein